MNPTVLSFLPFDNVESSKHWDYWDSLGLYGIYWDLLGLIGIPYVFTDLHERY